MYAGVIYDSAAPWLSVSRLESSQNQELAAKESLEPAGKPSFYKKIQYLLLQKSCLSDPRSLLDSVSCSVCKGKQVFALEMGW